MPNFLLTVLLITSNKEKKDYNDNNAAPVEYPIDYKYVLSSSRLAVNFLSSNVSASDISHGTSVVSISTERVSWWIHHHYCSMYALLCIGS